jgi:ankyrin repeat protein
MFFDIFNSKARALKAANREFLLACEEGDWPEAARQLTKGAQIEARDDNGDTALILASTAGQALIVRKLMEAGAETEARNKNGETALWRAASAGAVAVMRELLDHNACVDAADQPGMTPLGAALAGWHYEAARLLVEGKANVDARAGGNSLLAYAAAKGHAEFVKLLIDAGADAGVPGKSRRTPLIAAARDGDTGLVGLLLGAKDCGLNTRDGDNWTALAHAVDGGHEDVVKQLLEAGAEVETTADGGLTPFSQAVAEGHTEIMEMLWRKGANIDKRDGEGNTPLHVAILNENGEAVRLLLQWGASLHIRDGESQTAIVLAESSSEDIERMVSDEVLRRSRGGTPLVPPVAYPKPAGESAGIPAAAAKEESNPARKQFRL